MVFAIGKRYDGAIPTSTDEAIMFTSKAQAIATGMHQFAGVA